MHSLRLALLSVVGAALLAACGTLAPQAPAPPQVSVDTTDLTSLSLKVEPKSPELTLLYQVNNGAEQTWQGSSTTAPKVDGACPGNNSLNYTAKWHDQVLLDHQSADFFYDPQGSFSIGGPQSVQLASGQTLNLSFPLAVRGGIGCAALPSAKLDGSPVAASVTGLPPVASVSAPALGAGSHSLVLNVKLGIAEQTITVPIVVGTASGGTSTGGTSSGGTSTGGTSTPSGSVTGVALQPAQLALKVGGSATLKATVSGKGGFDTSANFVSADPKVATVDDQGNVKALAVGQTTVTATSKQDNSKSATTSVTVTAATQGSFTMSLAPSSLTIKPGSSDTAGMGIVTSGGYTGLVNLTIGDPPAGSGLTLRTDRTTINPNVSGVLTVYVAAGASAGNYTIPVTASDGTLSSTAQLTITVAGGGGTSPGDTQKPTIGTVSLSGATLTSTPASVTVAASDNVAVSSVTLAIDGGIAQSLGGSGGSYGARIDLSTVQNGTHNYLVTATDASGNSATASGSFSVQIAGRGPSVLKSLSIGNTAPGTGALIESSGTALIGSGRQVLRIDPNSGTVTARSTTLDGSVEALVVSGGTVYVATAAPSLWALTLGSLGGETKIGKLPGNPHNFAQSGLGLFLATEGGIEKIVGSSMTAISQGQATSIAAGSSAIFAASAANRQIVQMDASGNAGKSPISVNPAWIAMNASGSGLNVATATGWNMSYLDPANWTLTTKVNLRAVAVGVVEYNNQMAVMDNVGNLFTPDGSVQQVEKSANASFGPVMSGSSLYAATDGGTLFVYRFDGNSATYQSKTSGLGKLGAALAVDGQGRIYYPNAAGTLYILQEGN